MMGNARDRWELHDLHQRAESVIPPLYTENVKCIENVLLVNIRVFVDPEDSVLISMHNCEHRGIISSDKALQ